MPRSRTMPRSWARRLAAALAIVWSVAAAAPAGGELGATVIGPPGNPVHDGTPAFTITTSGAQPSDLPLRITLQIATHADFSGTLFTDTTITGGTSVNIVIPRLLPQQVSIWWRARITTASGALFITNADGPHTTSPWLTLIAPIGANGVTLNTTRRAFLWSGVQIHPPVQPWIYQIFITRTTDGLPVQSATLSDTGFTSVADLESNTSYKWSVTARLPTTGDSTRATSPTTFVILDPNAPIATVLYPSFPNPFPNERIATTCIWFDLKEQAEVRMNVLDLRGNHVATILPGHGLGPGFPAGRYGRAVVGSATGCDDRLTWDGRDDRGRYVAPGVYLIRFQGDGMTSLDKVLWKGH